MKKAIDWKGRGAWKRKKYLMKAGADYHGRDILDVHPASKIKAALSGKEELSFYMLSGIPNIGRIKPLILDGKVKGAMDYDLFWAASDFEQFFEKAEMLWAGLGFDIKENGKTGIKFVEPKQRARYVLSDILGESEKIKALKQQIYSIAESDAFVFITGETGSGKELIANSIHHLSRRGRAKLVEVNCAAIPDNLVESELFGYEEGSFTGAKKEGKMGKFEMENKGTIFLDEIDQLPYHVQPKQLRVLQEQEVDRIGGRTVPIDIRVIAATNKDLKAMVEQGTFREDLYYRINVIPIVSPPLRERKEDIPLLVQSYLTKLNRLSDRKVNEVSQEVYDLFQKYNWPGNVRELLNTLERGFALCRGETLQMEAFKDLFFDLLKLENVPIKKTLQMVRDEAEREAVRKAMEFCGANKSKAAEMLGITRTNLYYKLEKFGLT